MGLRKWLSGSQQASREGSMLHPEATQSLLHDGLGGVAHSITGTDLPEDEERLYIQRRIAGNPMWTLDRGTGFYQQERLNKRKASLLGSGKQAGKSIVQYEGIAWTRILKHVWRRDFFTTAVHARFYYIVAVMIATFISSFMFWAVIYYVIWRIEPKCFVGFKDFLSAFLFSIETQNTIGYGSHAIGDCWIPAWLVGIQCILAVLLEAVFLGIIFAKISHPKGRSRTILISECACIARRDGILKFMFRVADIRKRTAISPKILAHLYTWGAGHRTAEGEYVPVQVQALPLHFNDPTLLLPVVVEHTIDERSPLYGHTAQSLEALGTEIVVTFEGSSELGDAFMTRRSYLPSEIHWGCSFVPIIQHANWGDMTHRVDLSRFHEVEPQEALAAMPPQRVSKAVVMGGSRRIPRARLGENTLQLADELVVTQAPDGTWFVAVRVGDAYPSQMCSARVQMFVYRYSTGSAERLRASHDLSGTTAAGSGLASSMTYVHQELPLTRHLWRDALPTPHAEAVKVGQAAAGSSGAAGQQQQGGSQPRQRNETPFGAAAACSSSAAHETGDPPAAARLEVAVKAAAAASAATHAGGGVNVLLRYPVIVGHEIGPSSPIREWVTPEGMMKDADAEIVVVATATMYITSKLAMRSKVYSVLGSIRWGHSYCPCVLPPSKTPTGHAMVDWSKFHDLVPSHPAARPRGAGFDARRGAVSPYVQSQTQPNTGPGQSQQLQGRSSKTVPAAGGGALSGGGDADSSSSWQPQPQPQPQAGEDRDAGRETFESQLEDMLCGSQKSFGSSPEVDWQQQMAQQQQRAAQQQRQQQQQQQGGVRSSAQPPSRQSSLLTASLVQGSNSRASSTSGQLAAVVVHGSSNGAAGAGDQEQQRQQQQEEQEQMPAASLGADSAADLSFAHSLGFSHLQHMQAQQAQLRQSQLQRQQLQRQQQQQGPSSSRGSSLPGTPAAVGPGFSEQMLLQHQQQQAAQGHSTSSGGAARQQRAHGGGFTPAHDTDPTLTVTAPFSDDSTGHRSLASVMNLFAAAEQLPGSGGAAGAGGAGAGAELQGGTPAADSSR